MSSEDSFFQITDQGLIVFLKVQPNASRTSLEGVSPEGYLKVKIKAPARRGKANQELIGFLSKTLGIAKSQIEILSGELSRKKKILLKISPPQALSKKLTSLI